MNLEDKIIAEAKTWLGTPWHLNQRSKGLGVDCIRFITETLSTCGLEVGKIKNYYGKPKGNQLIEFLNRLQGTEVTDDITPGCLLVFDISGIPWHCALATSDNTMIHATVPSGVIETSIGNWIEKLVVIYKLKIED